MGGEETWPVPLSDGFHKGEEAVICSECMWRKRGGAVVHLSVERSVGL